MVSTGVWTDASRLYSLRDGRRFALPMVHRPSGRWAGPRYSMPDAWGYGGVVGPALDADALSLIVSDLRRVRSPWIRIRPNPLRAEIWHDAASRSGGTLEIPKRAHVLNLDVSREEVFRSRFTSSCRRAIRSAEKAGLTVEVDTGGRLLPTFYALFQQSVERWATNQHEPKALARFRAKRRDPIEKLEAWAGSLGSACRILVARREGRAIAALIVLQGTNAHMTRGAMDRDLVANDRPNELLMWHAIQDAIEAGCAEFHMGESGESESLARYKEKFGARPIPYAEHRIEHLPATSIATSARTVVKRAIGFRDT